MKASDIDMQDLALVYDDEYGPDYVAGILASEFPALDTDTNYDKVLGMLKEAARRGEEDYPLNFLANRIAELGAMKENKMRITKKRLAEIIKEEYESIMAQEAKKPDFLDLDKDGNKEEPMEDAAEDKEEKEGDKGKEKKKDLSKVPPQLRKSMKKESLDSIRDLIKRELGNL